MPARSSIAFFLLPLALWVGCASSYPLTDLPPDVVENAARAQMNLDPFLGAHLDREELRTEEYVRFSWKSEDWLELWQVTIFFTVILFDPCVDVWVTPDGDGGTVLEVRHRTVFTVLFLIPILVGSEETEAHIAEAIIERARQLHKP